jgi:Tfp pilus assembly protein PilX
MIILKRLNREQSSRDHQRGVALLMALIALLVIGAITAGAILLTNTETNVSSNFRDEQLAFFSAKAGVEEARDRMQKGVTDTLRTASLPQTLPGTAGSVLYILNPANGETVAPWNNSSTTYPDTEICNEGTATAISCTNNLPTLTSCSNWCVSTTASTVYAASPVLPWKWVRVMLKENNALSSYATNGVSTSVLQTCWNGTNEETTNCAAPDFLPVYTMTALAVTPSGSRRMVQAEIAEDRLNFNASAALTLDGTGDTASMPHSNNFGISGTDTGGCGATTINSPVPAIGVGSAADVVTVGGAIPNGRTGNYTGSGGTTPDVENISASLPPNLQTVSSLQTLVSSIKSNVTQPVITGPATNISNAGTLANPQIIYVNGDLTLSGNVTGYGILVVTGTFTASGNVGWNGLVLVVGQGNFVGNGGGNNSYNGAILVAKTLDSMNNPLASLGAPTFNFSGGGGNGFNYASGCIDTVNKLSTFHIMAFREMLD